MKKRKIAVIVGSKSDLTQCADGLAFLAQSVNKDKVEVVGITVASIHRNTNAVLKILRSLCDLDVDAIIIGAGWANHLTGTCDAYLRYTLGDDKMAVIGVAFEDENNIDHTKAAILSITEVPGTQVVFNDYVGSAGFLKACEFAVNENLPEVSLKPGKSVEEFSLPEALLFVTPKTSTNEVKVSNYQKGILLNEGKTKKIWEVVGRPDLVIVEQKEDITAFDNPKFTKKFASKAKCANLTTSRVFELLKKHGIPVAYVEQLSDTEFLAPRCEMIPLEVVTRRYAVGSYLKRYPDYAREGEPFRFAEIKFELFLKTTGGQLVYKDVTVVDSLSEEDPIIMLEYADAFNKSSEKILLDEANLYRSKKPPQSPEAPLNKVIKISAVVELDLIPKIEAWAIKIFTVLEEAWAKLEMKFIDLKVEFGLSANGKLYLADVVDNDSWRLRDKDWQELSKESFRQGENLTEVERKYGLVAELAEQLPNL
ncbi:MAG: phosphoribosylaminoimidazolesuccinocarboxamide synthase [Patescibacteria group bacterium]